ncbi:hypothetical protein DITRI_Ditri20bG0059600 [Diplodiscus trichospermus]
MSGLYQDFEPDYQYRKGEAHDIIEFNVKDFRKDQMKVRLGSNGVLTVSGERPLEGTRWIRFHKEFNLPKDCKPTEIRARLSSGVLFITITKKVSQQDTVTTVQQAPPTIPAKQAGAPDVVKSPNENGALPKARPKSFISRLKMERKTAMKVVASVTVLALLFTVLFYVFKFYAPLIMHV